MVDTSLVQPSNPVSEFAAKNMWSFPYDNQQFRLGLKRVSPELGYVEHFQYVYRPRQLPVSKTFYQVYTMSGINVNFWNLLNNTLKRNPVDVWLNLGDLCSKRGVHVDLYTDDGKQFPRRLAWIMRTYDGLNLLAVEKLESFPLLVADNFYLRCYTPDWDIYHSDVEVGDSNVAFQYVVSKAITQSVLNSMTSQLATWKALGGLTSVFVNGVRWDRLPYLSEVGKTTVIEITYDPTVFKVQSYSLNTLPNFYSTTDKKRKMIVHPPKDESDLGFYSFDDCDFYITDLKGKSRYVGLNDISVVRQLTHRDYSLSQDGILQLIQALGLSGISSGGLTVVYRSTKLRYDLVYDANKIRYLYKMTDSGIVNAMTEVKSTVPEWTADQLEMSPLIKLDRAAWSGITRVSTYDALGYNGATKAFADTPAIMPMTDPTTMYDIPLSCQLYCVVLEYDVNGLYLGFTQVTKQSKYTPVNEACNYVEFIPGINRDYHYTDSQTTVSLPTNVGYRVFVCGYSIDTKLPDEKWVDVTGSDSYSVSGTTLTFNIDASTKYGRVMFNDVVLINQYSLNHIDRSMYFNFTDSNVFDSIATFAPANIQLILNQHPLIENVDYVIDYPEVFILNRKFVKDSDNQLVIIADGLSPAGYNAVFNQSELGYVVDGCIGFNNRFNIRDDRRVRLVCNGRLLLPSEIGSSENSDELDTTNVYNGYPYSVKHIYQSLPGILPNQDYVGFDAARDFDARASTYLTKNFTKKTPIGTNIQDKYQVYSPFLHLIVYAIKLGVITIPDPLTGERFSKQVLSDLSSAYRWILKYDPVTLNFDRRYFTIAPYATQSVITVQPKELLFITQLNEEYLQSACNVAGYFEVSNV